MAFRGLILPLAAVALTTGCYLDTIDERAPGLPGTPNPGAPLRGEGSEGNCHLDLVKGCFDGNVIAMKEFFVDGERFFNADDLMTRFAGLVKIEGQNGELLEAGKDYQLALTTAIGNRTFASEFTYDLTGKIARRDQVRSDGNFSINDLPEGSYDLRIQRPVRFDVVTNVSRPDPTNPDLPPTVSQVKTGYCATIYADTVLEIRKGTRSWDSFNDFQLHVTDDECSADGTRTTLSLPE